MLGKKERQGPGHSWVRGECPIITDAKAKPHNWFLQLLPRLLAREQLPSLLSVSLSENLFFNRKRQIN